MYREEWAPWTLNRAICDSQSSREHLGNEESSLLAMVVYRFPLWFELQGFEVNRGLSGV